MQKSEGVLRGVGREGFAGDEGLFLWLAGNNLGADNTRRSCNLADVGDGECVLVFIHFLARATRRRTGMAGPVRNGERGSGVPQDNRRHHPCFPDSPSPSSPPVLVPHRQTLIDVIFTLDTRLSFCNLVYAPYLQVFPRISSAPFRIFSISSPLIML